MAHAPLSFLDASAFVHAAGVASDQSFFLEVHSEHAIEKSERPYSYQVHKSINLPK